MVRVVKDNEKLGILPIERAMRLAEGASADLVEIAPYAIPPVCKIVEYDKFLYQQKKKQKELEAKASRKQQVKEIRFSPNTNEHDMNFKRKFAESFLNDGNRVKVYVQFQGRSIVYKDRGIQLLKEFTESLSWISQVEKQPQFEGRRFTAILVPKK